MKMLHIGIKGWELVFCLPAVSEVDGGILFRLLILNSVLTLILAVEANGVPHYDMCLGSIATRLLEFYNNVWLDMY
jgi:hypothetical protein